jgi:divalent metal cation (Fe/Co/Zn/Cd) transporter
MKLKNNIVLASLAVIALLAPSSAFAALTIGSTSVTSDAGLTLSGA